MEPLFISLELLGLVLRFLSTTCFYTFTHTCVGTMIPSWGGEEKQVQLIISGGGGGEESCSDGAGEILSQCLTCSFTVHYWARTPRFLRFWELGMRAVTDSESDMCVK